MRIESVIPTLSHTFSFSMSNGQQSNSSERPSARDERVLEAIFNPEHPVVGKTEKDNTADLLLL